MKKLFTALALIAGLTSAAGVALAETRVALVIGNDEYVTLPNLNNAGNDARGVAAKLKSLGFETTLHTNASRQKLGRTLARFQDRLAKADVGLVFYAGHGIQLGGKNYLVPSDARVEVEEDLRYEAIQAADFLETMADAGTPLNIVIIDACRDNPLQKRSRSGSRGLAVVAIPSSIKGTAILYSAGPGQVARDGPKGGHGVFTQAFLDVLDRPGLKLEEVFKQTAAKVAAATSNKQDPWINSSVKGDFYFRPKASSQSAAPAQGTGTNAEVVFWQSAEKSGKAEDYQAYLNAFPNGVFTPLARSRLDELKRKTQVASVVPTAPAPLFEVTSLDQTMVVSGAAKLNIREVPGGNKVGGFKSGDQVEVTGKTQHEGALWYRVAFAGGAGFVFGKYLSDKPQAEVKPAVGVYPKPSAVAPGTVFQDCPDCPEMVVVPPGQFMMGSPDTDPVRFRAEGPVHRVTIPASFAAGKYEVTFEEWDACVSAGGCSHKPGDEGWGRVRHPVIFVNWNDAQEYVRWLSKKTGKTYRLLSEAEWEYVARAGTTTPYHTGEQISTSQANYDGNYTYNGSSKGETRERTIPVGSFGANQFGLHDVHGNVREWVQDCWNDNYKGTPSDGSA